MTLKIILGGFCARSIGCIVNDYFDKDFDKDVERTKERPFASGQASIKGAIVTGAILFIIGIAVALSMSIGSMILIFLAAIMTLIYPLTKRFFLIPQLFLGFTYNMGILIAAYELKKSIGIADVVLYLTNVLMTLSYDTVYASADEEDDKRIGVINSSVLTFGEHWPRVVSKIYNVAFCGFGMYGLLSNAGFGYYLGVGCAFTFNKFFLLKHLKDPIKVFVLNNVIFLFIFLGLLFDILIHKIY